MFSKRKNECVDKVNKDVPTCDKYKKRSRCNQAAEELSCKWEGGECVEDNRFKSWSLFQLEVVRDYTTQGSCNDKWNMWIASKGVCSPLPIRQLRCSYFVDLKDYCTRINGCKYKAQRTTKKGNKVKPAKCKG